MGNQGILQIIMIGILLLCGYLFLFQMAARRTENKSSVPIIAAVLLVFYLIVMIPLVWIISQIGDLSAILLAILLMISCIVLAFAMYALIRNFREINRGMLALLLVYVLALAYITIFSRQQIRGSSSGAGGVYLFRFDLIREAIRTRSLDPVNHLLLNVAMFVPVGFLLPLIYPKKLARWSYSLLTGLMMTTLIEFVQMMLRLGQADLTDIVTNTLGALFGYAVYLLFTRLTRKKEAP